MAKLTPLMLIPPVAFAALAVLFMSGLGRDDPNALPSTLVGSPAPVLELTPLADLPLMLDDDIRQKGVKLVNFWASWCAPCRAEHPNLKKLQESGVAIYGVNEKDKEADALKFLEELGNPYLAIGQDANGRQAINWGVYGVPETFVIDGKGIILLRFPGPITERVMKETILPAMAKASE
ncbi:MAG: DsbE family thiol:disulfide interchange protein [Rhodobacteraceae bacterium]|nr:DsbE family thiol:disulfide interchange protein [Paracoccaceae bacterium]